MIPALIALILAVLLCAYLAVRLVEACDKTTRAEYDRDTWQGIAADWQRVARARLRQPDLGAPIFEAMCAELVVDGEAASARWAEAS